MFVQQIFPDNENEIKTLAGIGLSPLTPDVKMSLEATQLFVQELVQANNKETITVVSLCWLVICWYPFQNTALFVNLEQLDRLFNRLLQLTTKKM